MNKIKKVLKAEFINGQTKTDWYFLIIGLLVQIAAIIYTCLNPEGMTNSQIFWTSVSGVTGIVSVVLCAQKKISFYIFGFIQLFSYVFAVAVPECLWGEVGENVFYFITMIIGMVIWARRYTTNKNGGIEVASKQLGTKWNIIVYSILAVATVVLGIVLTNTNDPLPWYDSITTTAPFIAQVLLMFGYRDQWIFWAVEDVFSLVMFASLGNWIMVAQYLFWTVNTVYGWFKWKTKTE